MTILCSIRMELPNKQGQSQKVLLFSDKKHLILHLNQYCIYLLVQLV